jgi:hypothetical protein
MENALLKLFDKISKFESDNSGYSIGKSTIKKVFDATQSYSKEDLLARLTIIDSIFAIRCGFLCHDKLDFKYFLPTLLGFSASSFYL